MTPGDPKWYSDPTSLLEELRRAPRVGTPPLSIPGYEQIHLLCRGGQGAVYQALQESTNRRVAIKVLYEDASSGPQRRQRFEREIDLVAKLQHPHVVRVYDSGSTADQRLYFVMEYIEGLPLNEYISAQRAMSLRQRLALFATLCEAVNYAHQHGVIHRDLKPSNIRVDHAGTPHILDFGIAKWEHAETQQPAVTRTGQFLGTLAYASPEQLQQDPAQVDIRSDVYSLGVILYEMLTGSPPYPAVSSMADAVQAVTHHQPAPPSTQQTSGGSSVCFERRNDEVDTMVLKALAKDPARRYQTAEALGRDVARYLAGEPIDAKRDSNWYVFKKLVARNKLPFAAAAAFMALLVVFGVAMSVLYGRADAAAAKAQQIQLFLEDTLASVEPTGQGSPVTVREVLDEAVHWVQIALAGQPEIEASLRHTIGNSYRRLGLFADAEEQLQLARDIRLDHFGAAHLEVARSLNALGLLRRDEGRLDQAEALFREALRMRRQLLGPHHLDITNNLINLGNVLVARDHLPQAQHVYQEALQIRGGRLGSGHPDTAMCLYKLALLHEAGGDQQSALRLHRQVLDIRRAALHAEHPDLARSLLRLGALLAGTQRCPEAEPLLRECLTIRQRILAPGHWRVAEVQSLLGRCLLNLQHYQSAEPLLLASYENLKASRSSDDPQIQETLAGLVALYENWNRPEQAQRFRAMLQRHTPPGG